MKQTLSFLEDVKGLVILCDVSCAIYSRIITKPFTSSRKDKVSSFFSYWMSVLNSTISLGLTMTASLTESPTKSVAYNRKS